MKLYYIVYSWYNNNNNKIEVLSNKTYTEKCFRFYLKTLRVKNSFLINIFQHTSDKMHFCNDLYSSLCNSPWEFGNRHFSSIFFIQALERYNKGFFLFVKFNLKGSKNQGRSFQNSMTYPKWGPRNSKLRFFSCNIECCRRFFACHPLRVYGWVKGIGIYLQ